MKRIITILTIALFLGYNPLFSQGGNKLPTRVNVGAGFWSVSPVIIPVHTGIEFGLGDAISIGIDAEWRLYNDGFYHNVFTLQARGDYYFNSLIGLEDKWDVYAGIQFGPGYLTAAGNYPKSAEGFNLFLDGLVGGRWYFVDNMALNAEAGLMGIFPDLVGPTPFVNFGLSFVL